MYFSISPCTPPGGHDGEGLLDTVERYDPQRDTWTTITNLSSPRCLGSLVALKGCLYAVGGYDGASVLQSLQVSIQVVINPCCAICDCIAICRANSLFGVVSHALTLKLVDTGTPILQFVVMAGLNS